MLLRIFLLSVFAPVVHAQSQSPEILFLHAYHKALWTDKVMEGYEAGLSSFPRKHTAIEYMDTKRLNTPEYLDLLARQYALKYGPADFDLILTSDDTALDFALEHQFGIFGGAPIVFCGVNAIASHDLQGRQVTGVVEHGDFQDTLETAFDLFPGTGKVWILCDQTTTGKKNLAAMETVMESRFPGISRELLPGKSLTAVREKILNLGPGQVIFFISFWQDEQGNAVAPDDLASIFKQSPVPVVGRSEWMIGRGLLGGKCVSGFHQGLAAARMGTRVLNGMPVREIPIQTESPNVFMFDYPELIKHGVQLKNLPLGSLIFNRPASLLTEYRVLAVSALLVMGLLVILVLALSISVARRKKVEQQLLASEARYQQSQKMEAVGQLAAGVAHDFNNLLTPIVGYTEMLLEDCHANAPEKPRLEAIHEAAAEARNLTRELLSFARKQNLELKVIDLDETLTHLQDLAPRVMRENIQFTVDIAPNLYAVKADPAQILQAGLNLINNAVDAMPKGGSLGLSAHNCQLASPIVRNSETIPAGDYVVVGITDNGQGIPEDIKDRIFEPFFTTKSKSKGTGLGLAAVYGIILQHHGHLWFSSEPGKGTRFYIYLPRSKKKLATRQPQDQVKVAQNADEENRTILLAEDDSMVRTLAKDALERSGFKVIAAEDGKDAMNKAIDCGGKFELLLSDVVMPGMDGVELYSEIKALVPSLKVLFMSGYAGDILDNHGVTEEGFELLRKPFKVGELLNRVYAVLDSEQT